MCERVSADSVLFEETQSLGRWWTWLLVAPAGAGLVAIFGYGMWKQLVRGEVWGQNPLTNAELAWVGSLSIAIGTLSLVLLARARLETVLTRNALSVRLWPLRARSILLREIRSFTAREYRPIVEFGGWGIRGSRRNRAYNAFGREGVQLELTDDTRILVGSQRARELERALASACASECAET